MRRVLKWQAGMLLATALLPASLYAVQILDADPELTGHFSGPPRTEMHFGSARFAQPQSYNHLLGSIYYEKSMETLLIFGFRLTDDFIHDWKEQGQAQFIFSIIEFNEGDALKVCPIHIDQLVSADSSAVAADSPPQQDLGSISRDELHENQLYSFRLGFQDNLKPGDIVWIGLDGTNPLETKNNNLIIAGDLYSYPGGSSPMLISGSLDTALQSVHGMSLMKSLNRLFYAPKNIESMSLWKPSVPRWVNPLNTTGKLDKLKLINDALGQELAKLPERPIRVPDQFRGFHSSIKPEDEGWQLTFAVHRRVTSIALYPAVRQRGTQTEVYAFPKRFTITAFTRNEHEAPTIVADWSQTDFPQSGLVPVIFPFPAKFYETVQMTVTKGVVMPGGHAFALSEVSFPRCYSTWPITLFPAAGDSLEDPPFWSADYATDGLTPFGTPSRTGNTHKGTFRAIVRNHKPIQIVLRAKQATLWNSFEFHPTQDPAGLPPEGFPSGFRVEFSNQDDFRKILRVESTREPVKVSNAQYPYTMRFPRISARCVRITLEPPHGKLLQLEEITFNGGLPLVMDGWYSRGKHRGEVPQFESITCNGGPGANALYDRIVNGYLWDPPVRRSVSLIRRNVILDELNRIEHTSEAIQQSDANTKAGLMAGAIMLAATLAGLFIFYQRRQSKKTQLRIRHQIQQDLHDEIGSKLSVISMITDFSKDNPGHTPSHRTELYDVNQCARTAIASLKEVIWLTDREIMTLDQCFAAMKNRAIQMAHRMKLELDFPKTVPPLQLSYQTKRNLILLFTEALNNAIKHSDADTICAKVRLNDRQLTLSVSDNGKGFDPQVDHIGIGLKSMNARACKLNGQLDVTSTIGEGTTVCYSGTI